MSRELFTIQPLSNREKRDKVRKAPVRPSIRMRDKANDYKRKGKFGNDWD